MLHLVSYLDVLLCITYYVATITLTSSVDGRQAVCPGEVVTYTCTAFRTSSVGWVALPDIDGFDYFPSSPIWKVQVIGNFQALLTNRILDPRIARMADLTTTLTVTATPEQNGTVVQCRGDEPNERMSLTLHIASECLGTFIGMVAQAFTKWSFGSNQLL